MSCEIGVAVGNAVDAIRAHADMVLALPDGQGVAELIRGPMLAGRAHAYPRRWQITLGIDDRGETVTLPASQLNVAVCGGTGKGKSYLAGLICEQLIGLGYSLVVFDPEGDHLGLGELRGVIVTGGHERRLADPAEVVRLLRHGCTSVVVDLSHLDAAARAAYAADLPAKSRPTGPQPASRSGWSSTKPTARSGGRGRARPVRPRGQGLPTGHLAARRTIGRGPSRPRRGDRPGLRPTRQPAHRPHSRRSRNAPSRGRPPRQGQPGARCWPGERTPARRSRSPWGLGPPPISATSTSTTVRRRARPAVYFRSEPDSPTGAVAANLSELEAELGRCDRGVLRHHCPRHDFSSWVAGVFHDQALAADLAAAEAALPPVARRGRRKVRVALIAALQARSSH